MRNYLNQTPLEVMFLADFFLYICLVTGKTHMAGGILLSLLVSCGSFPGALLTILGSILPDIDHKDSLLGKTFPFIPRAFKHRGFLHSLLFTVICWFICPYLAYGVLLHIVLDMFTVSGVKLFYPAKTNINIFDLKTDSRIEKSVFILIWFAIVLAMIFHFLPPGIIDFLSTYLQQLFRK